MRVIRWKNAVTGVESLNITATGIYFPVGKTDSSFIARYSMVSAGQTASVERVSSPNGSRVGSPAINVSGTTEVVVNERRGLSTGIIVNAISGTLNAILDDNTPITNFPDAGLGRFPAKEDADAYVYGSTVPQGIPATIGGVPYSWRGAGVGWAVVAVGVYPEMYFNGSVPVGWLLTMVAAGVRQITLSNRTYPAPIASDSTFLTCDDLSIIGCGVPSVSMDLTTFVTGSGSAINGGIQFKNCNRTVLRNFGINNGDAYSDFSLAVGCISFDGGSRATVENISYVEKSASRARGAHAFLAQGCPDSIVRNIRGAYGYHGCAIKSERVMVSDLHFRKCISGITLKSDTIAVGTGYKCKNVSIANVIIESCGDAAGGIGISINPGSTAPNGQSIYNVAVSGLRVAFDTYESSVDKYGISFSGQIDGAEVDSVFIDRAIIERARYSVLSTATAVTKKVSFGALHVDVASRAFLLSGRTGCDIIHVDELACNAASQALLLDGSASIRVDALICTNSGGTSEVGFANTSARAAIGTFSSSFPSILASSIAFLNSCTSHSGNSNPIQPKLVGFKRFLDGEIAPGTASATPNYDVMTLPAYFAPSVKKTLIAQSVQASGSAPVVVTVGTNGVVTVLSLPASTTYISFALAWD